MDQTEGEAVDQTEGEAVETTHNIIQDSEKSSGKLHYLTHWVYGDFDI